MILICSNCDTKYHLDGKLIEQKSQKVRCTYCDHTWIQLPLIPLPLAVPGLFFTDAPKRSKLFKALLIFLLIFFLGLSIASYSLLFRDYLPNLLFPVSKTVAFYKNYSSQSEKVSLNASPF